jgi:hypothetical protein
MTKIRHIDEDAWMESAINQRERTGANFIQYRE